MQANGFLISATVVLALAAVTGCANPADDKPEAVVSDPVESPAADAAGEVYTVAEGSTVGFVGSKVTGSHDGGFNAFEGEILVVDGDPEQSSVKITIDTTSLWADDERLTGHLKSPDFFDVETHPVSSFQSTAVAKSAEGYTVSGNLDLHGVQKSIEFPAQISVSPDAVTAQAEFVIQRFDFGIEFKGMADDLIRDEVVIKFDLVAKK